MSKLVAGRAGYRLLVAAAVIAAVGVAGCGSSAAHHRALTSPTRNTVASLPPVPQLGSPGDRQVLAYIARADLTVFKDHGCLAGLRKIPPIATAKLRVTAVSGEPSESILSSFAVLRLPAKASVPRGSLPSPVRVFVNYVRVAQIRYGWPFKIVPVSSVITVSSRCLAREASAVHASVAHASAKVRTKALQIEHDLQLDYKYDERHPEGLCVTGYDWASLCEPVLTAETRGGLSRQGNNPGAVTFYLVPNGVAHITAHYPSQDGSPSRTVTVPVINNLAVWKITNEPGDITPTIQWRAADGRIIRTILDPI